MFGVMVCVIFVYRHEDHAARKAKQIRYRLWLGQEIKMVEKEIRILSSQPYRADITWNRFCLKYFNTSVRLYVVCVSCAI